MLKRMLIIALCSLCIRCNYVNKQLDSEIVCRKNDFQYITQKEKGEISNSLFENVYKGLEYPKSMQNMKFSSKNTVKKLKEIYNEIEFYGEFEEGDLSL